MYIHTPTKQEYDKLMQFLDSKGYAQSSYHTMKELTWYNQYKEETVINASEKDRLLFGKKEYYITDGITKFLFVDEAIRQLGGTVETPEFKVGDKVKMKSIEEIVAMPDGLFGLNAEVLAKYVGKIYQIKSIIGSCYKLVSDGLEFGFLSKWFESIETPEPDNQNEPKSMYDQVVDIINAGKYALMIEDDGRIHLMDRIDGDKIHRFKLINPEILITDGKLVTREVDQSYINNYMTRVIPIEARQYTSADADYIKSLIDGKLQTITLPSPISTGRMIEIRKPDSYKKTQTTINGKTIITFNPSTPQETMTNTLQDKITAKYFDDVEVTEQSIEVTEQLEQQFNAISNLFYDVIKYRDKLAELNGNLERAYNRKDVKEHKIFLKLAKDLGAILVESDYLNLGAKLNKDEPEITAEDYLNS